MYWERTQKHFHICTNLNKSAERGNQFETITLRLNGSRLRLIYNQIIASDSQHNQQMRGAMRGICLPVCREVLPRSIAIIDATNEHRDLEK